MLPLLDEYVAGVAPVGSVQLALATSTGESVGSSERKKPTFEASLNFLVIWIFPVVELVEMLLTATLLS